jgi:hypothetical protein
MKTKGEIMLVVLAAAAVARADGRGTFGRPQKNDVPVDIWKKKASKAEKEELAAVGN